MIVGRKVSSFMSQRALILFSLLGLGAVVSGCDVDVETEEVSPTPPVTQPEGTLTVRVLDPQGRPLSGLDVIVSNERGSWEGEAETDAEGVAKLGGGAGSYVSVFYERGLSPWRNDTQHRIDSFLVTSGRDYELRVDPGIVRPTSPTMRRVSVSFEGFEYDPGGPGPLVFVGCAQGREVFGERATFNDVRGCGGPTIKARATLDRGDGTMLYGESSERPFVADGQVSLAIALDRTLPAVVYSAGPLAMPSNSDWTLLVRQIEGDGAFRDDARPYTFSSGGAGQSFALAPDPGRKVRFFEQLFLLRQGALEAGFVRETDATDAAPATHWSTPELKRAQRLEFLNGQDPPLVLWESTTAGSAGDAVVATFSFGSELSPFGDTYVPYGTQPTFSEVVWTVSMPPTATRHQMLDLKPEIDARWGNPTPSRYEIAFADAEGAESYEGYLAAATGTVTRSFVSDEMPYYYSY